MVWQKSPRGWLNMSENKMSFSPGLFSSVVSVSACTLEDHRFNSQSRIYIWDAGSIPFPVYQWMWEEANWCVPHITVFLYHSSSPFSHSLSKKKLMKKIFLGVNWHFENISFAKKEKGTLSSQRLYVFNNPFDRTVSPLVSSDFRIG